MILSYQTWKLVKDILRIVMDTYWHSSSIKANKQWSVSGYWYLAGVARWTRSRSQGFIIGFSSISKLVFLLKNIWSKYGKVLRFYKAGCWIHVYYVNLCSFWFSDCWLVSKSLPTSKGLSQDRGAEMLGPLPLCPYCAPQFRGSTSEPPGKMPLTCPQVCSLAEDCQACPPLLAPKFRSVTWA